MLAVEDTVKCQYRPSFDVALDIIYVGWQSGQSAAKHSAASEFCDQKVIVNRWKRRVQLLRDSETRTSVVVPTNTFICQQRNNEHSIRYLTPYTFT